MSTGALERVIDRAAARRRSSDERCEMCAEPIGRTHRHVLDTDNNAETVLCVCQACSLLFNRGAASLGRYRLVPDRRIRLAPIDTSPLGVPVGLAFFVPQADGAVLAHYPSPAGATRWEVDAKAWRDVVQTCPPLSSLVPRVEALLVDTSEGRRVAWIVPIDDCFRLVATVRREWQGLTGGERVRPAIEQFFLELRED